MRSQRSHFNPRAPCGARRRRFWSSWRSFPISTHAPLAGRDQKFSVSIHTEEQFQPTRPLRGATTNGYDLRYSMPYFNPRAPCGARPVCPRYPGNISNTISTHAPLAGRDFDQMRDTLIDQFPISTHAPLAGRDGFHLHPVLWYLRFQPTRPLRGATVLFSAIVRAV